MAEQAQDDATEAASLTGCAWLFSLVGPVSRGLQAADRIAALCAGDPSVGADMNGYSPLTARAMSLGELLLVCGRVDEARASLDAGVALAASRGETDWIGWLRSFYPRLSRTPDEFTASLRVAHEGLRSAEESGNRFNIVLCLGAVGMAEIGLGHFPEAAVNLERALSEARQHHVGVEEEARLELYAAQALLGLGDTGGARRAARAAVGIARRQGARVTECQALLNRARILRDSGGPPADVTADFAAALTLARETEATVYEAAIEVELAGASEPGGA